MHPRRAAPRGPLAAALIGLVGLLVALLVGRLWLWGVDWPALDTAPGRALLAGIDGGNLDYRRGVWIGWALAATLPPLALVAVAALHRRWAPWLVRATGGHPWRLGAGIGAGAAATMALADLPIALARFAWGRHHGVLVQPLGGWLADLALAGAIQVAVLALVGALVAPMMARLPRLWWVGLAGLAGAGTVVLVWLAPLIIQPLFHSTTPMPDGALRGEVTRLAERAGVGPLPVLISDAGRRTTAANAHVSGLGGSRRIVLYDTLVERFPPAQVRVVVAHELAHVARRHVLRGTLWALLLAGPLALLLSAIVRWRVPDDRSGVAPPPALLARRLAVLAAAAAVMATLSAPLQGAISRSYEREADDLALRWSGDPGAAIALQRGLVARGRGVAQPPAVVRWWFGTHPTPAARIARALREGEGR